MPFELVDEFFDTGDFAVVATYTPAGGSPVSIKVVFDAPFAITEVEGMQYQNIDPVAHCRTADVANATDEATLIINGVTYRVKEVQPDGGGVTNLALTKDAVV